MSVRLVEGQTPRTGGTAIEVDNVNKIISLLLREENNLLHVNEDNELYCDLQIENGIAPTDDFEVGVTTGIVNASDGRDQNGLLLHYETTSGAYAQWLYGADGKLYFDGGTGTFNQVYYSSEVNTLINDLRTEIAGQYMKYQDFNFDEQTEQGQTSVTLSLNTMFSPTANFVVNAPASVKDGQIYVLRVTNGSTPYTMTLSGMIENPLGVNTSLTANSTDQFVFLAVGNKLELQPCLPDRLSAFINDMGFITNTVNNLTNYYTKTETYTKAEVNNLVSNFGGFEVVTTLPATDIKTNVIYLLGPIGSLPDKYEEYIYSNNTWVLIGETSVDLTNYYTKTETNTAISSAISNIQTISMFQITDPTDQGELANLWDWIEGIDISTTLPIIACDGRNYFFVSRVSVIDRFIGGLDTYQRLEIHYTSQDHITRDGVGYIEIEDVYTAGTGINISNGGVISNTGVTSINGNTGAVTVNEAQKSSTAPSNPSQGDLWYDTTNNILKVYDGINRVPVGNGDMNYSDFEFETATSGASLTISDFSTEFTPNQNFSIVAGTVKEGMQYVVRINTGATVYTMSLGTGITNPYSESLNLTENKTTTLVFLATSSSALELSTVMTDGQILSNAGYVIPVGYFDDNFTSIIWTHNGTTTTFQGIEFTALGAGTYKIGVNFEASNLVSVAVNGTEVNYQDRTNAGNDDIGQYAEFVITVAANDVVGVGYRAAAGAELHHIYVEKIEIQSGFISVTPNS